MPATETELSGQDLKKALEGAKSYLEQHIDEVNALNIFPVPDGDTGINMYLTMKSAVETAEKSEDTSAAAISAAAARGALMGARGNSGVILSQILKGIAKGIEGKKTFSFRDFAAALHIASEQAYRVIANPVEGTILTVIREASDAASRTAERHASFARSIGSVVSQARRTVKKTPEMLPVLKEAGVVDAGAKGLYYFLKGMEGAICKKHSEDSEAENKQSPSKIASTAGKEHAYGFDVQFMIQGENLPVEEIRNKVSASGECPIAVGDENLMRIHLHAQNPDDILSYARSKGKVIDVVVEDMDQQVQEKIERTK